MSKLQDILKSQMSIQDVTFSEEQKNAAYLTAVHFADFKVSEYRESERKAINLEAVKLFPALWKGEWKMWLRKRAFMKAKKEAQIRANSENRPVHVVRSTDIAYVVQSTAEVRQLKKVGVYKKNVDAIKMNSAADFTAYPSRKSINRKDFDTTEKKDLYERMKRP